ncbi:MAG TPA: CBO0543 family protein [Bacillales bacterium]|nr:CBO0543 family protein [Bacillales bacterium]
MIGNEPLWMEKGFLWFLLVLGVFLFLYSLRKPPRKDWLLAFFITSYCSSILRVIVVEKHLLDYPVGLFEKYFHTSPLYEFLLLPVVSIYYYQFTYRSGWVAMFVTGLVAASALTCTEVIFEKYTPFVHYITWTWQASFLSIFLLLFAIRVFLHLVNQKEDSG